MLSPRFLSDKANNVSRSPTQRLLTTRKIYIKTKYPQNKKKLCNITSSTRRPLSQRKNKQGKTKCHKTMSSMNLKQFSSQCQQKSHCKNANVLQNLNSILKCKQKDDIQCVKAIINDCGQQIEHKIPVIKNNLCLNKIKKHLDQFYNNVYYKSNPQNLFLDFVISETKIMTDFMKNKTINLHTCKIVKSQQKISLKHFQVIKKIGSGGFSKVYLCRHREDGTFYAMKLIDKNFIVENQKQKIIMNERNIMKKSKHPFIIDLKFAFQTEKYLVFILEYCPGGQLFNLIKKYRKLDQQIARFYIIEILLGLSYLHSNNVVYRDIKPQNILLSIDGHIKIADLGLAKPNMGDRKLAYSFCGSPQYMSPQMILQEGHTFPVDYYCMGALLYELLFGLPPFYSHNPDEIYESVLTQDISFPQEIPISLQCKNLLKGLLCKQSKYRLGSMHGIKQILSHPWFGKNSYDEFYYKKRSPPFDFLSYQKLYFGKQEQTKQQKKDLQTISREQKKQFSNNHSFKQIMKNFYYDHKSKDIRQYNKENVRKNQNSTRKSNESIKQITKNHKKSDRNIKRHQSNQQLYFNYNNVLI